MGQTDFALVCDAGCDLPSLYLERTAATVVPSAAAFESGDAAAALTQEFEKNYRALAARGCTRIASVHSTRAFSAELACAEAAAAACADVADVQVIDSGSGAATTGMVLFRLACHRADGTSFEQSVAAARELSRHVRLLVIPDPSAHFSRRRIQRHRRGLLNRATSSLRVRISGERGLYLVTRGEITQLARATDLSELTGRLAHAMSAVAATEGELVYASVETGDQRALRVMEKPLDTNEFEARHLGTLRSTPAVEAIIGSGAVGVAFAPSRDYWRAADDLPITAAVPEAPDAPPGATPGPRPGLPGHPTETCAPGAHEGGRS